MFYVIAVIGIVIALALGLIVSLKVDKSLSK